MRGRIGVGQQIQSGVKEGGGRKRPTRKIVVLHKQPIAYIFSFAIDRQRLVVLDVMDTKRDQLFRKMVGSIVVGTVRNHRFHFVRISISTHKVIGRSL